mgnify:CR=1 FL=1
MVDICVAIDRYNDSDDEDDGLYIPCFSKTSKFEMISIGKLSIMYPIEEVLHHFDQYLNIF